MGRPRKYREGKEQVALYLEPDELKVFDDIRWREHKERAELARLAVLEYLKNHAEGNTTFRLDKWNEDENFKAIPTISSRSEIWYNHLKDCSEQELTEIMIQTTRINQQCKTIKGIK